MAGLLESCLRNGRLYYAGEVTDLDSKKDIRGIATDFLTTVAGHLYVRFAIADRVFDERNIPTYLKSGTRSLDRLDPELGLFDAQGHLIRSSPLVETVFDELRRRKDEDLDLDGKAPSGAAANLAGVPRVVFLSKLADYGEPTFRLTADELAEDLSRT